ncbi:MAG: hypothetical protein ACREAN_06720 [Nitrosopumilaceae archaeon]
MTVSIMLQKKPYTSIIDQTRNKISLLSEIFKSYGHIFEPKRIEVWQTSTTEALGGKRLLESSIDSPLDVTNALDAVCRVYKERYNEWGSEIIVNLRGVWVNGLTRIAGYMSTNNIDDWRRAYGDIELNVFSSEDTSDICDLFWQDETQVESLVLNFIKKYRNYEDDIFSLASIVYALGVPSDVSVSQWRTSYFREPYRYLVRLLESLVKENDKLSSYVRLFHRAGIMADLYGISYFRDHLSQVAKKTDVKIDFGSSLLLLGNKPNSYENMYKELSSSISHILENSLVKDSDIDRRLERFSAEVSGQSTILPHEPKDEERPSTYRKIKPKRHKKR